MSTAVEHVPLRPCWVCGACDAEWPCAPAKVQLAEEYVGERRSLMIYLAVRMWEAIDDAITAGSLGPARVDGMHERFLGWLRCAAMATSTTRALP